MLNPSYNESPERTTIVSLALAAAADGRAVFPLAGKRPLTRNGFKNASTQPQRITAMFNAAGTRATGYGIATGRASGIIVVDVDGPKAVEAAKRLGLDSGRVVKTGRPEGGGYHLYYAMTDTASTVKSRKLAPGLELKGDGNYVVGPGSKHPLGAVYAVVRGGEPSPAPAWLTEPPKGLRGQHNSRPVDYFEPSDAPVVLDVAGPPIAEGERNTTLTRIAGRLHDGTRTLDTLTHDLDTINNARCSPPLEAAEVAAIAKSIYGKSPCKPAPTITPRVKAAVDYLRGVQRPVKGMGGATAWSVYRAGLAACSEFGREHPQGVTLSLDVRSWAQRAGTSAATISRTIRRSPLMRVIERGRGKKGATVLFVAPETIGHQLQHSSSRGVSLEHTSSASVAASALLTTLERLRWGPGRIGKSKAALLHALAECSGTLSRAELASRLGRKPASLRAPLRWLVEVGLLERVGHGAYALPSDFARRVEDARELGREPEADRLQIARHARERESYRRKDARPADTVPERQPHGTVGELERVPDAPPELVAALRDYLRLQPRLVDEGASWLAVALWSAERVEVKPTALAVEAALAVIGCENQPMEKVAKGACA
jgi:hypothetical protein